MDFIQNYLTNLKNLDIIYIDQILKGILDLNFNSNLTE